MKLEPLRITAKMASPFSVTDNWSPSIEALLEYVILSRHNLIQTNPTIDQVRKTRPLIEREMPLAKIEIGDDFAWAASSPHYLLEREQVSRFRKKRDYLDRHLDWGNAKSRKLSGSEGHLKNYDLPLFLRTTRQIDWFVVGDRSQIRKALTTIAFLGKKRSQGKGEVYRWHVDRFSHDWSLHRNGLLARPVPASTFTQAPPGSVLQQWGWKAPGWVPEHQALCYVPTENVKAL